jgi:hypothetical protein
VSKRRTWTIVFAAGAVVVLLLAAGLAGYWRYANTLPPYTPAAVAVPVPNAYDDFVAAGQMVPTAAERRAVDHAKLTLAEHRKVVTQMAPGLARLRQGFKHEYLNPQARSYTQTFPELADYRKLARALSATGKLAEREGRYADAAECYLDCLRLGNEIPRGGTMIHSLVGLAAQFIGLSALQDLPEKLDGKTAARIARELGRLEERSFTYADALTGERDWGLAGMREIMTQPLGWKQWTTSLGASAGPLHTLEYAFTPKAQVLRSYERYMEALIEEAGKPYYARGGAPPAPNDALNRLLVPTFGPARFRIALRDAYWRSLQVRLAARAYQAEHGSPAASPAALVPAYLPAMPSDPFAPAPLIYRVANGRATAYSRGPDGDDDGGKDLPANANDLSDGDAFRYVSKRQ